jgi:hypothetical protein
MSNGKTHRKTKLISIRKLSNIVKLVQRKVDVEITAIDLTNNTVEGKDATGNVSLYRFDLARNSIEKIYRDSLKREGWDPFD